MLLPWLYSHGSDFYLHFNDLRPKAYFTLL
nr:MAG TPA: hypothetical protein [Caudoviricetes sp.]DAO50838.1 MAG TPA: hypothetical protein [Caudoviricetes sp.]